MVVGVGARLIAPIGAVGLVGCGENGLDAKTLKAILDAIKVGVNIAHEYFVSNGSKDSVAWEVITNLLDGAGKVVGQYYGYADVPPGDNSVTFKSGPAAEQAGDHRLQNTEFGLTSYPFKVGS
ncbi:MAG: hypothetical protein HY901_04555 [Deltaproteobacteria bacterium]|nr:hypothetical protein [Deltaproteobacteria bacterium]